MSDEPEVLAETPVEVVPDPVVEPAAEETPAPKSLEERVGVGSKIDRTPRGWAVQLMYGGARRLHGEGATIEEAVTNAGA